MCQDQLAIFFVLSMIIWPLKPEKWSRNCACDEGICGSGLMAPFVRNLGTRCRLD
jgi:hypothetical protein